MKLFTLFAVLSLIVLFTAGCSRVITSGRHNVKSGTTIPGNLIITSGRIVLEEGSRVDGSVLMTSGNLAVYGEVDGNILMTSGQVYAGPEAIIHGSIRGTSGTVQQAEGARILGEVSTDFGEFNVAKFLALAGAALYFLMTGGRRLVGQEKRPVDWKEKSGEKGSYI